MLGDTGFNITEGDEIIERLSERFYFLRYLGLAVCGKTQNQSARGQSSMDYSDLTSELQASRLHTARTDEEGFRLG